MTYAYKQSHIPKTTQNNRRPCIKLEPTSITIHNTGNPTSTAQNERDWLTNFSNTRQASYHIVIDSKEAIEVLPLNEVGWHAGDGGKEGSGNRTSIGIEICERDVTLGEYAQTLTNAVDLVAKMLLERNWGIERLKRHYDWSKKNCPRLMNIDNKWTGWFIFLDRVQLRLNELKGVDEPMTPEERKVFEKMQKQLIQVEPPAWFVKEFGQDFINNNMSNPKMIPEGWRSLAIALRAVK